MDPLVILFGFGVGILVGLTGVAGGSLMPPILSLIFGFKPVTALGTDTAYGAVTKTVGGWRHFRQRTVVVAVHLDGARLRAGRRGRRLRAPRARALDR